MKTLLIDSDAGFLHTIKESIEFQCPQLHIVAALSSAEEGIQQAKRCMPDLILMDLNFPETCLHQLLHQITQLDTEIILISKDENFAREAINFSVAGYIVKPVNIDELNSAILHAQKKLKAKEEYKINKHLIQKIFSQLHNREMIGVPTMEGFDYFQVGEIIRCEGMQRCTRIITKVKTNTISSYNLGEFRQMLEPYGFFSPHKSHLINLSYIRQYKKEGIILMTDGSSIPVSRNKKNDFINQVAHP